MINDQDSLQGVVNIQQLIDDARCYQVVRNLRWPNGIITCTRCDSENVIKHGYHNTEPERRRYHCNNCDHYFDDLSSTVFEGHHQPLRVWILCLYFMGLNISNRQIAKELGLNESDVQQMTTQLREGVTQAKPIPKLKNEVESDEVYIVAGHKGKPNSVKK
ncbi:MAG: IS1 family transposase, partial [Desulfosarcina sp.]|nr:IS1 family transposase [Desulfobacterales bacterium]